MDGPFSQQLRIMDSLSSRQDLLSPHEHVIGVGVFLVKRKMKCPVWRQQLSSFKKNVYDIFYSTFLTLCLITAYLSMNKTYRIVWIGHRVEWSNSQRVFIQHIEVSIILRKARVNNISLWNSFLNINLFLRKIKLKDFKRNYSYCFVTVFLRIHSLFFCHVQ